MTSRLNGFLILFASRGGDGPHPVEVLSFLGFEADRTSEKKKNAFLNYQLVWYSTYYRGPLQPIKVRLAFQLWTRYSVLCPCQVTQAVYEMVAGIQLTDFNLPLSTLVS